MRWILSITVKHSTVTITTYRPTKNLTAKQYRCNYITNPKGKKKTHEEEQPFKTTPASKTQTIQSTFKGCSSESSK